MIGLPFDAAPHDDDVVEPSEAPSEKSFDDAINIIIKQYHTLTSGKIHCLVASMIV